MEAMAGFCRACLVKFDDPNVLIQYTEKNRRQFLYLTGIQVKKNDQFIFQLCKDCYQNMTLACKFKKLCRTSDKQFKQYLALNEAGGTRDFEEFLRTNESTFRYPLNNEFSTPIYKPTQDGDNASTCTSFRSFMKDLMKPDDLPDTAYKIMEEVIQEEADIMDDSIDSQWLQDDTGLPDLNFDFSFSMFRSPYATDSPQDNRFALTENRTPDHQYAPFVAPYTPNKYLNTVTQNSVNNTSTVNTEEETNNTILLNKFTTTCRKDLTKVNETDIPENSEVVKFDTAPAVKETSKDENNDKLDCDNTKKRKRNKITQIKREITSKQESDEPKKYNLRKVKPRTRNVRDIDDILSKFLPKNYVYKWRDDKPSVSKKKTKRNITVKKRFFKGRIPSENVNDSTQSDSFSLSEFNIRENDTILKTADENTKTMLPLNQDLTKYTSIKNNENFAVLTNVIDLKQYQEIDNISTNQYNKLENTPISFNNESDKQNYSILDIGTYHTDIVTDKIYEEINVKTEQSYKIENIGTNFNIETNLKDNLLNIGLNRNETVHDIDRNIEMALNQSNSNLVQLEDILNSSGVPSKFAEQDQKTDLQMKSDIKQYFESFIEEINTPLETTNGQQPRNDIIIIENIKIKEPNYDTIIEKFINDNKDSYNYSLNKLRHELVIEINKMYDLVLRRCEMCNIDFKSEWRLRYHLVSSHKLKVPRTKKIRIKAVPKNHKCLVCGKPFQRKKELERHGTSHECKGIYYTCDICELNFPKKSGIKNHMISHMMDEKIEKLSPKIDDKNLECNICGKRMKDKGNMITHKKRHEKLFKHQCSECNMEFISKSELTSHSRVHTGDRPFACHFCDKSYGRRDSYHKHLRKHHEKSLFHCPFCNLKCIKKKQLDLHLRKKKACRERKLIMNGQKQTINEGTNPGNQLSIPEIKFTFPETDLRLPGPESYQTDVQFEELLYPEISIPDETPEATLKCIKYVEDDMSINLFPQNNNLVTEHVINPSFF